MTVQEFDNMFQRHHSRLLGVALRLTGNRQDAEDLVQETFLKLWRNRDRLDSIDNIFGFCTVTLRNLFVDSTHDHHSEMADVFDAACTCVASDIDIYRLVESRDGINAVLSIIETLPPNQRDVMKMRDIDNCSFEEIQANTGLSPTNIRSLLSRARKKVIEQFDSLLKYENL